MGVGGVEKRDPNVSIPGTWSKHTNQNIKESQGARAKSTWLRGHVKNTITQNANNMNTSWNCTNSALQQRISETRTAKENLQSHLDKTNQEILDQDKEITRLTKALRDKE